MGTAFEKTDWQPGVTPYSTSEMNRIEAGIAGAAPVGQIILSPGPQTGYIELDGSVLSRTTYDALFDYADANDLIGPGKFFGDGDGATTFQLPDWSGRVPIGASASRPVGSQGGSETHSHTNPDTSAAGGHAHSQPSTGSAGSHSHSNPSSGAAGSHSHDNTGVRVGLGGNHNHGGATGSAGSHSHTTGGPSSSTLVDTLGPDVGVASSSHTHGTSSDGSHGHSIPTETSHDHGQDPTSTNGGHSHAIGSTGTGGSHAHSNPNTDSVANHQHTQTATNTTGHLPPWAAVTWLIRY